jgi:hypothetical protein
MNPEAAPTSDQTRSGTLSMTDLLFMLPSSFVPFHILERQGSVRASFALIAFFSRPPEYRVLEETRAEFGYVGKIYVGILHGVNPLPVCSGRALCLPCPRFGSHRSRLSHARCPLKLQMSAANCWLMLFGGSRVGSEPLLVTLED